MNPPTRAKGKSRLLVLEGSDPLRKHMTAALHRYVVVPVATSLEADHAVRNESFDALLIDLLIDGPDPKNVLDMISTWRTRGERTPIVCVGANHTPERVIATLRAGADHLVRKPFHFAELMAHIDRLIHRYHEYLVARAGDKPGIRKAGGGAVYTKAFTFGQATIDQEGHINFISGEPRRVRLNFKQVGILYHFAKHRGSLVTPEELIQDVWGPHVRTGANSLAAYLSGLRALYRNHGENFDLLVRNRPKIGWEILSGSI